MSSEEAIEQLRNLDFKEINSACSKNNINLKIDDFSRKKFEAALRTAHLLISQPIEFAVSSQTKHDSLQAIRDMKKIFDSLYLATKDQKYKLYLNNINELISHSKIR